MNRITMSDIFYSFYKNLKALQANSTSMLSGSTFFSQSTIRGMDLGDTVLNVYISSLYQ